MDSKTLNTILDKILNGDLKYLVKFIEDNTVFDNNGALKFIVALCTFCAKNISTKEKVVDVEELARILRYLVKFVTKECNIETYLRAVFHILKYLITKEELEKIPELQQIFVPEFIDINYLDDKDRMIYQSCCKSIYNVIVSKGRVKNNQDGNLLLKLSVLLMAMYKKLDNIKQMIDDALNCSLVLVYSNIDLNNLNNFYQYVLNLFKKPSSDDGIKKSLLMYLSHNFNNFLKNSEFNLAKNCMLLGIEKLKSILTKKDICIVDILTIWQFLIPGDYQENFIDVSHKSLKDYCYLKNSETIQLSCSLISSASIIISQYNIKNPNNWVQIPYNIQLKYYKYFYDLAQVTLQFSYNCQCGNKNCDVKNRSFDSFKIIHSILQLLRLELIDKNSKIDKELMNLITKYIEKQIDIITELQKNNCKKWETAWYDCGLNLYNTAIHFWKRNRDISILFFKYCTKYLIKIEGTNSSILGTNIPQSCLSYIAQYYHQEKDLKNSIIISSFSIAISLDQKNITEIQKWISYKAENKNNDINDEFQELTLPMILEKFNYTIQYYHENFKITNEIKQKLLIIELNTYKKYWKSKKPMMAAYRQLFEIIPIKDVSILADIFLDIWGKGDLHVDPNLPNLLNETIKKFEKNTKKTVENKVKLAHLYFLHNKYRVQDAIVKNNADMDMTLSIPKSNKSDAAEPMENIEECDIVSSYDNLKFNNYNEMLGSLYKSIEIFSSVIKSTKNSTNIFDINLYSTLKLIANEFRLHSNKIRCIQAWQMAYNIADTIKYDTGIMQSIGALIELNSKDVDVNLVERSDSIAENLDVKEYLQEIVGYYICKAFGYFGTNLEKAMAAFEKVRSLRCYFEDVYILNARFMLLQHKFLLLPCEVYEDGHENFNLGQLHIAYNNAIKHYSENSSKDVSYDMSLFFDITEEIGHFYHSLRMPREVRCYLKEVLLVTQRCVLPLRTMSLLYYLAHADIVSCRFDDCKVKLAGFDDILCLSKPNSPRTSPRTLKKQKEKIEEEMEIISTELGLMMLDAPSPMRYNRSPGSPTFRLQRFQMPSFIYHDNSCDCFYCILPEIQNFILKKIFLHGLLNVYENNVSIANDYFCGGIKLFQIIKSHYENFVKKVGNYYHITNVIDIKSLLLPCYCCILLEYTNNLCRWNRIAEAKQLNNKLLNILEPNKLGNDFLYQEALSQSLNITALSNELNHPPKLSNKLEKSQHVSEILKTPPKIVLNDTFKTPVAPRIKIYTDTDQPKTTKKTTRTRSKASATEIKTTVPSCVQNSLKDEEQNLKLSHRTRLLTKRLRSATRQMKEDLDKE